MWFICHGLTAADVDYSGKLDLFSTSFDGNVRMFFSREGDLWLILL